MLHPLAQAFHRTSLADGAASMDVDAETSMPPPASKKPKLAAEMTAQPAATTDAEQPAAAAAPGGQTPMDVDAAPENAAASSQASQVSAQPISAQQTAASMVVMFALARLSIPCDGKSMPHLIYRYACLPRMCPCGGASLSMPTA